MTGIIEEDSPETTIVKAQKLTKHKGCPCARDYDDVTQEFMLAAIGDYWACLCAKGPMPDHAQETALLNMSWDKATQTTGINLVWTLQLSELISVLLAISIYYYLCDIDYQPWITSSQQAQGQAVPSS